MSGEGRVRPKDATGAFVVLGIVFMVLSFAMEGNGAFLAPGIVFLVVGLVLRGRISGDADRPNADDSEDSGDG